MVRFRILNMKHASAAASQPQPQPRPAQLGVGLELLHFQLLSALLHCYILVFLVRLLLFEMRAALPGGAPPD